MNGNACVETNVKEPDKHGLIFPCLVVGLFELQTPEPQP
jgi:hypothetical protein